MCLLTCLAQLRSLCLGRSRIFALNGKEQRVPLQAQIQQDESSYGSFKVAVRVLSNMACLAGASWPVVERLAASHLGSLHMSMDSMAWATGNRSNQCHWQATGATGSPMQPCSSLSR